MGSRNGFDAGLEFDEIQNPINRGSGTISVNQRLANALVNLGLIPGTAAQNGNSFFPMIGANGTLVGTSGVVIGGGSLSLFQQYPAGTATQAPELFTAGVLLTAPAAGAFEYDGNAWYATPAALGREQMDAEQFTILASNFTLSNVNTAQKAFNASTNGAVALAAGKQYLFEGMYNITNTGTSAHTWATLFGGTATFTTFAYQGFGNSVTTANTAATGGLSGFSTSATTAVVLTPSSTSATEQVTIEIMGTIVVNAAGTLIPQVQLSAAPGGTQTMLAGSFFRLWEMSTAATVGSWT